MSWQGDPLFKRGGNPLASLEENVDPLGENFINSQDTFCMVIIYVVIVITFSVGSAGFTIN